ncbi:MAG: RNA-guided endonuclease InsQ/TnpB family protein [Pyrinomonadaceae bacterium]
MKLTLQIQLLPDTKQAVALRETLARFNEAASWLAEKAFELRSANKIELQQLFYADIRKQFNLSAQMTVRCIAQVCEAYKRDKKKLPKFRRTASMPFDQRMMSFKGIDRVSLLTLQGRVIVPFVMGKYQRERFTAARGQCDLVLRKDGKWFLLVTVDLPDRAPTPATDFIGVDLGVMRLATSSDGEHFSGNAVESVRQRYHARRQTLQHAAARRIAKGQRPKAIRRALKRTKMREANFRKHENHRISKQLVELATDTTRGIALEELKGIRERARFRKSQRAKMSGWAFSQFRNFIAYKAQLAGVSLVLVDPRNTSRTCNKCSHCEKANRQTQDKFLCKACGHAAHADENAARNIRQRARDSVSILQLSESVGLHKAA